MSFSIEPQEGWRKRVVACAAVLLLWAIPVLGAYRSGQTDLRVDRTQVYSPASNAIEPELRVFSTGFDADKSAYQGAPNAEKTRLWHGLVKVAGMVKLSADEASRLPNTTTEFRQVPDTYFAALEVFHQLHCLNHIRTEYFAAITSPTLQPPSNGTVEHVNHCIDYLRQTLMCHGDVGVITFNWAAATQDYTPDFRNLHQCRNFEAITQWALDHRAGNYFPGKGGWADVGKEVKWSDAVVEARAAR